MTKWKLMPEEPTAEIIEQIDDLGDGLKVRYRRVLKAAPDATEDPELVERAARWCWRRNWYSLMGKPQSAGGYNTELIKRYENDFWQGHIEEAKDLLKHLEGRE